MLGFLAQITNIITGDINAVKNWILSIIQAVYSFVDRRLNALGSELVSAWNSLTAFITTVEHYAISVYNYAVTGLKIVYNDITSWAESELAKISSFLAQVYHYVLAGFDYVAKLIAKAYDDIEQWVVAHIWNPLWTAITQAWNWITHEGAFIYDLLTHPEKLASLLGQYLWSSYLDLLRKYGKPIGKWLLHSMIGLAGDFVDVLETIISGLI